MNSYAYVITKKEKLTEDIYSIKMKPVEEKDKITFVPGQFCRIDAKGIESIKNHFFSVASSPNSNFLEFCFKIYGDWTKGLSKLNKGDNITVAGPYGKFVWDGTIEYAVFLAGGIGITPFLSMLRFIREAKQKPSITILYGNRTEDQIIYRREIENIISGLSNSKVVYILSDIKETDAWAGYKGFITQEIIQKEIRLELEPTFFLCGPPVFIDLSKKLLSRLNIGEQKIKQELF